MIAAWGKKLPFLYQEFKKGNIHKFDSSGFSRELDKEQIKMKETLEKDYDVKVIAVIDSHYLFQDDTIMHFVDYLLLEKDEEPEIIDKSKGLVSFFSYTQNVDDDSCSEMGYIGLKECVGLLKRVY